VIAAANPNNQVTITLALWLLDTSYASPANAPHRRLDRTTLRVAQRYLRQLNPDIRHAVLAMPERSVRFA
jgi:hypothetical protein